LIILSIKNKTKKNIPKSFTNHKFKRTRDFILKPKSKLKWRLNSRVASKKKIVALKKKRKNDYPIAEKDGIALYDH